MCVIMVRGNMNKMMSGLGELTCHVFDVKRNNEVVRMCDIVLCGANMNTMMCGLDGLTCRVFVGNRNNEAVRVCDRGAVQIATRLCVGLVG